jgi:hypothetical protein
MGGQLGRNTHSCGGLLVYDRKEQIFIRYRDELSYNIIKVSHIKNNLKKREKK